jgi:hypothetical protein
MRVTTDDSEFIDDINITLLPSPQVFAGEDGVIVPDSVFITETANMQFADEIQWSTTGDGSFNDSSLLIVEYYPGPEDINSGFTQLVITGFNASCEPKSDTLNLFIRNYFIVEGRVNMADSNSVISAVIAVGTNASNGDLSGQMVQTDAAGNFRFEKLFAGEYLFYAFPDTANSKEYLPAYHPDKTVWQAAFAHNLIGDEHEIDITLPRAEAQLPPGPGRISGKFLYSANSDQLAGIYCQPWFSNSSELFCDGGLSNATIFLYGESGQRIYDFTLTATNGTFNFQNLPYGNYYLQAEIAGYESITSEMITLTPASPAISGVTLSIRPEKKVVVQLPNDARPWFDHLIYPIPAKDVLYIEARDFEEHDDWTLEVHQLQGSKVKQLNFNGNNSKFQVDVSDIPPGFYILIVKNNQYSFRKKILISR